MAWSRPIFSPNSKIVSLLATAMSCLLVGNVLLLHSAFESHSDKQPAGENDSGVSMPSSEAFSPYFRILRKYFRHDGEEFRLADDALSSTLKNGTYLDCAAINRNIVMGDFIASGWTKASYKARTNGSAVAVKTVNIYGHDVTECLKKDKKRTLQECYRIASSKILNEIVYLKHLNHQNVLKMLGYCVPDKPFTTDTSTMVSIVTELGEPLDIIKLLQMSWEDRLRVSLGMGQLLFYLSHSPLGNILMKDFRRQQFILVNGEVKLSDVDDIVVGEPFCHAGEDCKIDLKGQNPVYVPCIRGYCRGYNEKSNILKASRHFTSFILPHGAPGLLKSFVEEIISAYRNASWNSETLLSKTREALYIFVNGKYKVDGKVSKQSYLKDYKVLNASDLPGMYDYRCKLTLSGHGCSLSIYDDEEAAEICSTDPDCKAFVVTRDTTWTGRRIVYFKNNFSKPVKNLVTTLYYRNR